MGIGHGSLSVAVEQYGQKGRRNVENYLWALSVSLQGTVDCWLLERPGLVIRPSNTVPVMLKWNTVKRAYCIIILPSFKERVPPDPPTCGLCSK